MSQRWSIDGYAGALSLVRLLRGADDVSGERESTLGVKNYARWVIAGMMMTLWPE